MGIGVVLTVRFWHWIFSGQVTPDPWGDQISTALKDPESLPVYHRCLTEHSDLAHFCHHCGAGVGEFNNVLPFEQIFSEGELLRNGTTLRMRPSFLVVAGYAVVTFSLPMVGVFVLPTPIPGLLLIGILVYWLIYWSKLLRNWTRPPEPPLMDSNI